MFHDVLQALAGVAAFLLCFFAPGYVAGSLSNVMGFRNRSLPEKALWAIALSGPVSTILACVAGILLPPRLLLTGFAFLGVGATILVIRDLRRPPAPARQDFGREFWTICACMAGLVGYCIFATLGIQTRHSLYESVVAADWSVRVPLVAAAVRGRIPPLNPFFALGGVAPPMRYYYFWYEVCAQVARLTHIDPRSSLVASTAWSAISLIAVIFLYIKYLSALDSFAPIFNPEPAVPRGSNDRPEQFAEIHAQRHSAFAPSEHERGPLRRICLLALGLACVMGLYLLPTLTQMFFHGQPPPVEIEFWSSDRMPSCLGAILFAPHHVAGIAYGAAGFLLLALLPDERRQALVHAVLAAICFAALVGTSTYLALCFGLAGFFLFLVKARFRRWNALVMIAVCTLVALLLAGPFIHQVRTSSGLSVSELPAIAAKKSAIANHMFKIVLRSWHFSYGIIGFYAAELGIPFLHAKIRYLFPLMLLPFLYIIELNFFAFVIWYRAKADLFRRGGTSEQTWLLWALFFGIALPALLLSSEPTQGINDLGRQAGLALRLVLIVWAAPMVFHTFHRLRSGAKPSRIGRWVIALTVAGIAIGLLGQLWQVTMDRIYIPLEAHRMLKSPLLFIHNAPFLAIREANRWVDANLPASAIVQSNPEGLYQPAFLLYLNRQTAAGDRSCESAFGGDFHLCREQVVPPLHALFGRTSGVPVEKDESKPLPNDPAKMTGANFETVCARLHLRAMLISSDDPAWHLRGSWVWSEPVLYANQSVRVIACPASGVPLKR